MTYLFFMKMLDDVQLQKESASNALGLGDISDPTFPRGRWTNPETGVEVEAEQMRWHVLKNNTDPAETYRIVKEHLFVFIKNLGSGDETAYTRFMTNAVFLIPSPRVLSQLLEQIDALPMMDHYTMGDVYEYALSVIASSGTNGQFRTPRHIIRMMVDLMQPRLDDSVCDPAMGSAGFLVETARYVKEHYAAELMQQQCDRYFRTEMLHGFDTDQTMLRIGAMNLMLHDIDSPEVAYRDSLSNDNADADRYSLILANPPFAGSLDYEVVAKSLLATTKTRKTELLFLALFLRSLQVGGRCASIVPDGVLTGTSTAHKALRRALVEGNRLQAVISMPSGVFQPYSGVSTAVVIFTKTNHGGTDRVWFYDMHADGYSLDAKRTEVSENDIPDIVRRFSNLEAEADRARTEQSFLVPLSEIQEHDYDLAFNTYKEIVREEVAYDAPEVILDQVEALAAKISSGIAELRTIIGKEV
jgi:type I restriction enzyme M protein